MMRRDAGRHVQHRQEGHCMRHLSNEGGFTFVELLAVVLLLGILLLVALPNSFGAENDARREVDRANVRSINTALALYRFRNSGTCPAAGGFAGFLAATQYFPDGAPIAPWTSPPRVQYIMTFAPPGGPYPSYPLASQGGSPEPDFPKSLPAQLTVTG